MLDKRRLQKMENKNKQIQTFSENKDKEGRVLLISLGGAGIENRHEDLNENLREAIEVVPYLSQSAGKIDYIALTQKDSSDLTSFEVASISKTIRQYQNAYDGFVIIGGTDTMPYTASATAFALRGMGTPIVFTGATQNARDWDSDFRLNLPNAIKVAVMGCTDVNAVSVGEVCVLFDDTLSRATSCISRGTRSNNPIITPRVPKLGDVGWTVKVSSITKPRRPSQLNYSYNTNTNIAYFDLVSETHLSSFDRIVDDPTIKGIMIGAFGAGNIPAKLVPSIYTAVFKKGKAVAVITNCKKGSSDMGLYDVGAMAVKAGAISLGPMTKPAAIEKMRYALNNAKGDDKFKFLQDVARLLLTTVAEEIPSNFSRSAVNQIRERFESAPPELEKFFTKDQKTEYNYEVKKYCKSKSSKYKILCVSMGGTFFQEPNPEGSLIPTQRKLNELFDKKLKNLSDFVSLDFIELANKDSTDISHTDRAELAKVIARNIKDYHGVVVLHGTDTLSYSASSLSYMLLGLDKDVMFTGSQKPGFDSSDFDKNFVKSIKAIITRLEQPENKRVRAGVKVSFGDKLMLGSTVIKEDEHGINAFAPVEKHELAGTLSHHVELNDITKNVAKRPFTLFTGYDIEVAYFECISAIDIKQFENYIENPKVKAILIGGYDEGNMPIQMKYYIATAVNSYHKPIAFVSNTDNGIAEITSEGRIGEFIKAGAIALGDMIKESAFQKLCFALGIANKQKLGPKEKIEFVRKILHTNLTGEISDKYCLEAEKVYRNMYTSKTFSDEEIKKAMIEAKEEIKELDSGKVKTEIPKKEKKQEEKLIPKITKESEKKPSSTILKII